MKRELREVLRQLDDLERALREEEMKVLTLGREIKDLASLLERLRRRKAGSRASVDDLWPYVQQLDSEMARVSERMGIAQAELRRLAAERAEQEGTLRRGRRRSPPWNRLALNSSSNSRQPRNLSASCGSVAKMRRKPVLSGWLALRRSKSAIARRRLCSRASKVCLVK